MLDVSLSVVKLSSMMCGHTENLLAGGNGGELGFGSMLACQLWKLSSMMSRHREDSDSWWAGVA